MDVVVTIPAYNEERTIGHVIEEIKESMKTTSYKYTILVVDDGSEDDTIKVAEKKGAKVVGNKRTTAAISESVG